MTDAATPPQSTRSQAPTQAPIQARTLIVLHGVGSPAPGELVENVANALALDHSFERSRETLTVGTERFERMALKGHPTVAEIVEVNWTDIQKPPRGPVRLIVFLFRLVISLIQIGAYGWRWAGPELRAASTAAVAFRFFLAIFGIWVIGLPLIGLHMVVAEALWVKAAWVAGIAITTFLTTLITARMDPLFRTGFIWTAINAVAGGVLLTHPELTRDFIAITTPIVDVAQVFGFSLVLLAFVELFFRLRVWHLALQRPRKVDNILPYLVRLAHLYLPLIFLSGLAGLIVTVHLTPYVFGAGAQANFTQWTELFAENRIGAQVVPRIIFTVGALFVGALLARAFFPFLLSLKDREGEIPNSGRTFQDRMAQSLILIPLVLLPLGVIGLLEVAGVSLIPHWFDTATLVDRIADHLGVGNELLGLSLVSALVILIFVPLLIGPGRTILDVTGDIIFYILPEEFPAATALPLRRRLETLFDHLGEICRGAPVLVAYSQGSVIAVDAVQARPDFAGPLITVGSPVQSLYGRFLAIPVRFGAPGPERWDNLFRPTDFVGGPIGEDDETSGTDGADADIVVTGNPASNHLNYWPEPEVRAALQGTRIDSDGTPS